MKLVRGDGEQIAADAFHADRNLAGRLHGIGVKPHVGFGSNLADLFDGLQNAGFVVGHHDGDQARILAQRTAHALRLNLSVAVHAHAGNFASQMLQPYAGAENRAVLDGGDDDVIAGAHHSLERQVVSLRAAAGEDHFRGQAVKQRGNPLAGFLYDGKRAPSATVNGRGIAEGLSKAGQHLFHNLRQNSGCAVVIEIMNGLSSWLCLHLDLSFGPRYG